ncbi:MULTISPECIES: hypothetical protein [unclassified Herbaspirillum]|uniref:hypothetical protein n=1 Tax=unclassified Herbaspirillum TaxID=2624150 RepID=UPI0011501072|nr:MULTISPECIES: hypothetical protein [unclassified Herbaspirillum]MBB5391304.1 hypothetical protein [Herbaspirillum sp. SJZ102]TQK13009.1 hypothetical protein FB599_0416 [Herbaspirillum sp. SJZ130]TQK15013.1 hypothetical protein FB598_0354 [Herbaspirillum sp. SJZ106]
MQVSSNNTTVPVDGAHPDAITPAPARNKPTLPPPSEGISEQAVRSGNIMELSLRSEHGRTAGAGALANETPEARLERFNDLVTVARKHMLVGRHEDAEQFEVRVQQRAQRLLERGENPRQLEALFTFSNFGIDLPADAVQGALLGAPFAFANLIAKFLPALTPANSGALSGAITILLVHAGSNAINQGASNVPRWGNTTKSLEDILPEQDPRGPLTAVDVFKKIGSTFQLFPVSFAATGGLASGIALADLPTAVNATYGIGPATAVVGSSVVSAAGHAVDRYYNRIDSGHILSEDDWEGSLDELKRATFKDAAANGLNHVFNKDTLGLVGEGLKQAVLTLPNLSTLAQGAVWTGGLSLYSVVTAELNKNPNLSDTDKFIRQQMMFAAALVPITFLWTAAIAVGPLLDKKAGAVLSAVWESLPLRRHEAAQLAQLAQLPQQ